MKIKAFILFIFIFSLNAYSAEINGVGYGANENEAKREALADLSSIIKVRVYSKLELSTSGSSKKASTDMSKFTRLITDVPLINPNVECLKSGSETKCIATLGDINNYTSKLKEITGNINNILNKAEVQKNDEVKYRLLESAIGLYYDYDSYSSVPLVLGITDIATPIKNLSDVTAMLLNMRVAPPSLEVAAEVLTSGITAQRIFVPVIKSAENAEATPFAIFFTDMLSKRLNSVPDERASNYTFNCTYLTFTDYLAVSCSLNSGATVRLNTTSVKIPLTLLKGIDFSSKSKGVSSIMDELVSHNSDLRVQLKISSSGDQLLLREGEYFTLMVKANQKSYIYIVGYNKDGANLMEIEDGQFFIKIDDSDAGHWMSLGRFKVQPPFGSETLQVFALSEKPEANVVLPGYARGNFGKLPVLSEKAARDFIDLFKTIKGSKASSYITINTVQKKQ